MGDGSAPGVEEAAQVIDDARKPVPRGISVGHSLPVKKMTEQEIDEPSIHSTFSGALPGTVSPGEGVESRYTGIPSIHPALRSRKRPPVHRVGYFCAVHSSTYSTFPSTNVQVILP